MNRYAKNALRVIAFLILAALLLGSLAYILLPNKTEPGVYSWASYKKLKSNTVDLLVIGSSHTYSGFDCAVLYEKYGISAFDLCASGQQMWNSYYTLREALKTQTPKVIVLEAYLTTYEGEYDDGAGLNLIGFPYTENRIANIQASLPAEERIDYYLPWIAYHGRYNELAKNDFIPCLNEVDSTENARGNCHLWRTTENAPQTYKNTGETTELLPKVEQYYRACIELAQEKKIPLVVDVLPYVNAQQDMEKLNQASAIAAEYGVPFVNMNEKYDALGLDFATDFADWAHLNYLGADKVMTCFGAALQQDYSLADHRGDAAYSGWADNAAYYDQLKLDALLQQATDFSSYTQILAMGQAHYTVLADVPAGVDLGAHAAEFCYFGILAPQAGIAALSQAGSEIYHTTQQSAYTFRAAGTDYLLEGAPGALTLCTAGKSQTLETPENCITLLVWDNWSQQLISTANFDAGQDFALVQSASNT